jgi:hypothetical protein
MTTIGTVMALAALLGTVGADARWLAAIGHTIVTRQSIPAGVPFAGAPTAHWPNVIVLAELAFHGLEAGLGDRGLMLAQLCAVGIAFAVLARDALAGGASAPAVATTLLLAALGALPSLAIARVQLFSLALFPLLVALLRSDARTRSRRIWLSVPLLALWSNLHGAVLVALGVMFVYLALVRFRERPGMTIAIGAASFLAVCVTPAGLHTVAYYHGVLTNVAAERGEGLWGPVSLTAPFDVLLVVAALGLAARALRARPALWELAMIVLLAGLSIRASRSGVWLLFFLVAPAARGAHPKRTWSRFAPVVASLSLVALLLACARGPSPSGASPTLVARALALAQGTPVLATDIAAEQVALGGGRVWVSNPIDAFSRQDQSAYLDWLEGRPRGLRALSPRVRVVLAAHGSPEQSLMARTPGFVKVISDRTTALYLRTG